MSQAPGIIVRNKGRNITSDYNEVNVLESDSAKIAKLEMWIAKNIGDRLVQHYPNREWGIRVDVMGQMVILTCDSLSLTRGYYLPMKGDTIDMLQKRAVKACGEILERFNISRDRNFNPDVLETLDRDLRDEVVSADAVVDDLKRGLKGG